MSPRQWNGEERRVRTSADYNQKRRADDRQADTRALRAAFGTSDIDRRVEDRPELNQRRRAADPVADERLIWAEKYFAPIFRYEIQELGKGIVAAVEKAISNANGPIVVRVSQLETGYTELKTVSGKIRLATIGWGVGAALVANIGLIFLGKAKGWWL